MINLLTPLKPKGRYGCVLWARCCVMFGESYNVCAEASHRIQYLQRRLVRATHFSRQLATIHARKSKRLRQQGTLFVSDGDRPNPDALLSSIQRDEAAQK